MHLGFDCRGEIPPILVDLDLRQGLERKFCLFHCLGLEFWGEECG